MKLIITLMITMFVGTTIFNTSVTSNNIDKQRSIASVRTPQQAQSCAYSPKDIAPVVGYGSTIHKARSAASKICFERRIDLFEKTRNAFPTTEQGQLIIDSCVNIKCK